MRVIVTKANGKKVEATPGDVLAMAKDDSSILDRVEIVDAPKPGNESTLLGASIRFENKK